MVKEGKEYYNTGKLNMREIFMVNKLRKVKEKYFIESIFKVENIYGEIMEREKNIIIELYI